MSNTETVTLHSVRQGTHGKWAVYVGTRRVSRFFDERIFAIAFGVPKQG